MDLVRCARGVDVGYKEDSTSTTSTSTCIHRYPTFLPFGSSRSDGNRWMLKVYFLPSVEPSTPNIHHLPRYRWMTLGRCSPCSTTVLRLYRHLLPSRSRNTVVDGEPVAARCSFLVLGLHRAEVHKEPTKARGVLRGENLLRNNFQRT